MRVTAAKVKNSLITFFGIDRLDSKFLNFAVSHLCFIIATNIHSVFVNILLMRVSDDVNITIYYNMISYFCSGVSMMFSGMLIKRVYLKIITFTGIGCHVLAYGIFLFFMDRIELFMIPIAVLLGFGGGFFWFTYFNALTLYSQDDTRDISISFIGVFASVIALIVPAVAGAVIDLFEGYTGYEIMFACAFLISGISIFLFTRLPKVEPERNRTRYRYCFKRIFTNRCWFLVNAQVFLRSTRDGVFLFFLNVLLYEYVASEALVGLNSLLCGFMAIFSQFLCGKVVRAATRIRTMLFATCVLTAAVMLLAVQLSAATILILSLVNAFFVVLLMNPASSIDFLVVSTLPDGYACRGEYLAIFELVRGLGRNAGLIVLLLIPKTEWGYVIALTGITLVQFLTIFCASRTQKEVAAYQQSQKEDAHA